MFFEKLQERLLLLLRGRVQAGEVTERSLAKLTEISQPHIHNVLKGTRKFSPEIADSILRKLGLTVLDLFDAGELVMHLSKNSRHEDQRYASVDMLDGDLGPGRPLPTLTRTAERFTVPQSQLKMVTDPVALAPHPSNKNEIVVWDLAADPSELFTLNAEAIRQRMFSKADELPEGVARLPIKTIHINKSPIVIGNLKTLSVDTAAKWGLDVDLAHRHAELIAKKGNTLAGLWSSVFERPAHGAIDVDEDLYGGFIGNEDRRSLQRLRGLSPEQLADKRPAFADKRLDELLFRYRARNFSATLTDAEQAQWQAHCAHRLHDGAGGSQTLTAFFEQIDALQENADERGQEILGALVDYATEIAPERD